MTEIHPPDERQCVRCGREEVWDDDRRSWTLAPDSETAGWPHCLHEWDINGAYNAVRGQHVDGN
ncbi:MAG: HEWD family protein [Haloarculaceae archaeon]